MKKITLITMTLAVIASLALFTSCKGKTNPAPEPEVAAETETAACDAADCLKAVDNYLATEVGPSYAQGEYCIPSVTVVACDDSNADDIRVWGDFWVYNYKLSGDVLETVSGGNHPGLMHLKKTDSGYEVTAFDQVADGHDFEASAKEIFGDNYEAFSAVLSNADAREEVRRQAISCFVKNQGLTAAQYQDYGWPARQINP